MTLTPIKTMILISSFEESRLICECLSNLSYSLDIIIAVDIDQFHSIIANEKIECLIIDQTFINDFPLNLAYYIRKLNKHHLWTVALILDEANQSMMFAHEKFLADAVFTFPFDKGQFQKEADKIFKSRQHPIIPKDAEILIVEDNIEIVNLYIEHLKRLEHSNYVTCTSLTEAIKLTSKKYYDILILDWNLQDGTGIDLLQTIRSENHKIDYTESLIVAITGRNDVSDILTLLEHNVKDFIIKPFGQKEFDSVLTYALGKKLNQRELKRT